MNRYYFYSALLIIWLAILIALGTPKLHIYINAIIAILSLILSELVRLNNKMKS